MKVLIGVMAVLLMAGPVLAQREDLGSSEVLEEKVLGPTDMMRDGEDLLGEMREPEVKAALWIWGRVESVDFAGSTFALRHLDYATADEVIKTLSVDDSTVFHGVLGLADLEMSMHVTVDYKEEDGRCAAQVVNVETGKAL